MGRLQRAAQRHSVGGLGTQYPKRPTAAQRQRPARAMATRCHTVGGKLARKEGWQWLIDVRVG
jgi:hypothetical protein